MAEPGLAWRGARPGMSLGGGVRYIPLLYLALGVALLAASLQLGLRQEFVGVALVAAALLAALPAGQGQECTLPRVVVAWLLPALVLLCLALAALFVDPVAHVRHAPFFGLFGLAAALVGVQAAQAEERDAPRILAQVSLLALAFAASVYWLYPGWVGVDPWFHGHRTEALLASGHVPAGSNYSPFPGLHLFTASAVLVAGLSAKSAYFLVAVALAALPWLAYAAARAWTVPRTALLASLLLALTAFFVYWGFWISSNSLGAALGALAFALVLGLLTAPGRLRWFALFFVAFAALLMSHALSTFVTFVAVVAAAGASALALRSPRRALALGGICGVYGAVMVAYWSFGAYYNGRPLSAWAGEALGRLGGQLGDVGVAPQSAPPAAPMAPTPPAVPPGAPPATAPPAPGPAPLMPGGPTEPTGGDLGAIADVTRLVQLDPTTAFLVNLGLAVFFALLLAGAVELLRRRGALARAAPLVGAAVALVGILYAGVLLGAAFILPHRWFVFALFLGAPIAALGLERATRGRARRSFAVAGCALLLTAGLATSSWSNPDNPALDLPTWDRYGFTEGELAAADFAHEAALPFSTDFWFVRAAQAPAGPLLWNQVQKGASGAVVVRTYVLEEALTLPVEGGYYTTRHVEAGPLVKVLDGKAHRLYDSGDAQVYAWGNAIGGGAP